MKLTTALYTAAFALAPAVGFAADQSEPYPDWSAIAKTAPQKSAKPAEQSEPQKSTDQEKAVEQSGSSGNKAEPSLLEKAGLAFEAIIGTCGQLRQACLDEDQLGQGQSKCQQFRATCGSNWLPRP